MLLNSESQSWEDVPNTSYYVDAVAFSPDGRILASCHHESPEYVKLWDVASGELLYSANFSDLNELGYNFWNYDTLLFFSPDGNALTVAGFIWNLAQGNEVTVRKLQSPRYRSGFWYGAAVSPDLQIAVTKNEDTCTHDFGRIKLWETSTGQELDTYFLGNEARDTYKIRDIYISQFSPDGKIFASLIYIRFDSHSDRPTPDRPFYEKIKLWEVATGTEICSILLPYVTAYTKYQGVLAFSPDSRILASNCGDTYRTVILLSDTATGGELCRFEGIGRRIESLAFSPNNQFLASGDFGGEITLWELRRDGLQSLTVNPIKTFTSNYKEPIKTLAFSPDGRTLVSGLGDYGGGMTLWDINSGRILKTFAGHRVSRRQLSSSFSDPDDIAISPDGNTIASIDDDRSIIKLWHIQNGVYLHCLKYTASFFSTISQIAFSQDSRFLVGIIPSVTSLPSKILIWEVATGKVIQSIPYSKKRTETSFILNQDGSLLVVVEIPKNLKQRNQIKVLQVLRDYHQHRISVRNSTFISKFKNFLRRLFNPKSLLIPTICKLPYKYPRKVIFSPDKQVVAILSISEFEIWEIATGELIRIINIENSQDKTDPGEFVSALFSPDSQILVVSKLRNITFWKVTSGKEIHTIDIDRPHWFTCLAFSPDGRTLAFTEKTGILNPLNSEYNTIKLWDVETRKEICIVEVTSRWVISLSFTRNGEFLVSSYSDGTIGVCRQNCKNLNH
ncbi:MAG: hypothetical protein AAGF07_05395 [Patescibacteria group bacterium]